MVKFIIALYIVEQKGNEHFLNKKNLKAKQAHTFEGFPCSYNIKILNLALNYNLKILNLQLKIKQTLVSEFQKNGKWW